MNNKQNKRLGLVIAFCSFLFINGCKKDEETIVTTENNKGVIVVNEGGFLKSNGSVGIYKPGTSEYFDLFQKTNGRPLGDVVQSMTLINEKYYIIINNSNKIEVVNQSDFKSVTSITVNQPRNIIKVSETKAYISQFDNSMGILDLGSNTISGTINVKSSTENMALLNNKVYVGKAYSDKIFVINTVNNNVVDSLVIGSGLSSIVNVGDNQLAMFCLGAVDFNTGAVTENGKIVFLNKDSVKVERKLTLATGSYGGSLLNNNGTLYFTFGNKSIYSIASSATTGTGTSILTTPGSVYGFNVDATNGNLYVTDAGDYSSAGKVYIYNSFGVKQKEFIAGIVPSKIIFNY